MISIRGRLRLADVLSEAQHERIKDAVRRQVAEGGTDDDPERPFAVARYNRLLNAEVERCREIATMRRARLLPAKLTVGLAVVAVCGWVIASLAGPVGHLVATVGALLAVIGVAVWARLTRREQVAQWAGIFRRVVVWAGFWVTLTVAFGPGWGSAGAMGAVLLGGAWVVAGPWIRAHTPPLPAPPESAPEPAPAPPTAEDNDSASDVISVDLLTTALRHCKVPILARYLDQGGVLEFVIPPRAQGGGTYTQVRLPMGVVAVELLNDAKVELLAGNLDRHRHEVWPQRQPDADARVLDLWVADKGTMDQPAPPWPLLHIGEFDVFRDRLPWGVTMRGEPVAVGMLQKHWLVAALSKQGKTATVRLLALGLALDPTVELHIADLKGDGDWSMFAPRAATLIEGSAAEQVEATAGLLQWAVDEVARRYEAKRAGRIIGDITRDLSRRPGSGFHPIWLIVDECHVVYTAPHPVGGTKNDAMAWQAAKRLHDQARAVHVHLIQATQRPDDRAVPAMVREGAHVRAALHVPSQAAATMVLADAAERGARPQDLRPGADAGTVVATGEVEDIPPGQACLIIRSHHVDTAGAYPVIGRAMQILADAGRTVTARETSPDSELPEPPNAARPLSDNARTVLTDMRSNGHVHNWQIIAATELPGPAVFRALTELADHGLVARLAQGHWDITDLGHQMAQMELTGKESS